MMTTFPSMLLLMVLIPDLHDGRSAMDRSFRPYPRYWSSLTFFNQSTLFPIQRFLNDDPRRRRRAMPYFLSAGRLPYDLKHAAVATNRYYPHGLMSGDHKCSAETWTISWPLSP